MYRFSRRSYDRLKGVRPELIAVAALALSETAVDFGISEGLRTLDQQKRLMGSGATQTLRSRHLSGHAIDVVAYVQGEIRWDWPLYGEIAGAMKHAARELGVPIEWGGDWETLRDGPHFQLPWAEYPAA